VFPRRPTRVKGFSYCGYQRYSLTICSADRRTLFRTLDDVEWMLVALRAILRAENIALLAYCFMPDHVHLLVEGRSDDSRLEPAVARWKQVTAFEYKRRYGARLWQAGYYDRVLRDTEAVRKVALYILGNPVRAGLVTTLVEYPLSGSDAWSREELVASVT
jgi:putative transposase